MILQKLIEITSAKRQGAGYVGHCPAHEDKNSSLSINVTAESRILVHCHAGCDQESVISSLKKQGISLTGGGTLRRTAGAARKRATATYEYCDESGSTLFRVVRYEPKDFRQSRPDGRGGWIPSSQGARRVPYRLPELMNAIQSGHTIFIVEGEKDCEALENCGLAATTNAGGAGKWRDDYSQHLRGADVVILPDNDEAGRKHAQAVAASVSRFARSVRILELRGIPAKGDVSDWLVAGGTTSKLLELATSAPAWPSVRAQSSANATQNRGVEPWVDAVVPDGFELCADGVFRVNETGTQRTKICGPLWVEAKTRDAATSLFGFVVRFRDLDGKVSEPRAFRNDVLTNDRSEFLNLLSALGLHVMPGALKSVRGYLSGFLDKPLRDMRSTSKTGWLEQPEGRLIFVLPHETLGTRDGEQIVFQPERLSPAHDALTTRGTLDEWLKHVGALCERNPVLVVGTCLALAAPLLKPATLESGGLHWYGRTTRGKTTSLRLIASVIGCGAHPNSGRSAVQYWNATANALEALAAAYNDLLLPLDEIDECDASDFGTVIFRLIGGRGRARLDKVSDLVPMRTWRNLVISTGEIPVWQKIEQDRRTARGGQKTRLADVPVAERIFLDLHGRSTPRELADDLQRACERYYGTLLPEFIRSVIEQFEIESQLKRHVQAALDAEVKKLAPAIAAPEQLRVIRRIALAGVAGELAHELKVLPWSVEMIHQSALHLVRLYLADSASVPDHVRGVWAVCDGFKRHRARFRDLPSGDSPQNLLGYTTQRTRERPELVLLTPNGLAELCQGHNVKDVLAEFDRLGVLYKTESDHFGSKHAIDGARQRLFALDLTALLELETHQAANISGADGAGR